MKNISLQRRALADADGFPDSTIYCALHASKRGVFRSIPGKSCRVHASLLIIIVFLLAACASSEESTDTVANRNPEPPRPPRGLSVAPTSSEIGTVQVYRTGNETSPPLITLGTAETITVSFDLLSNEPRTLSIYFYHANRRWERDLIPIEYLRTFHRDELTSYRLSYATDVPYSHYDYEFPSPNIDFTLSGNYILRVTDFGDEEEILFERPFFISEQSALIDLTLDNILVPGRPYTSIQPLGRFKPASENVNIFDFEMCFVRNDQYAEAKCATEPRLSIQPGLAFYLEPFDSFELAPPASFLNLAQIRVGGNIEFTDLSVNPPEVALEPDYANFPGSSFGPFLNGQSVVRAVVRDHQDPDLSAEYVNVFFRFVPINEVAARGRVIVTGSFNNWERDPENALVWKPEKRWYEGSVLMKQGHHEYRYLFDDPDLRRAAAGAPPGTRNLYTAFLYSNDILVHTDRLISVRGILMN